MHALAVRWFGPSRTLLALRLAMTVAWGWIAVTTLLAERSRGPATVALVALGFATFLAALWANLRRAPRTRATRLTWILLGVQAVSGLALATDLMLLLVMELPLVLRPRQAAAVFGTLLAGVMVIGLALARSGEFVAAPEAVGLPPRWQVALTLGSIAGWQLLAFCGGLLAATEIRARREVSRLMAALRLAHQQAEESSRAAERLHIARELHDAVGHRLAALGISLDLESRRATGVSAESLREARDSAHALLAEVREVVGAMRQDRPLDLKRAVAALVSGLGGIEVDLAVSPGLEVPDSAAAHALYRCAQEAITNALRHAQATRLWIALRRDAGGVALTVRDDGDGADAVREGHGLSGMRERIEQLGGTLAVRTSPGDGFEIAARLPLELATP